MFKPLSRKPVAFLLIPFTLNFETWPCKITITWYWTAFNGSTHKSL